MLLALSLVSPSCLAVVWKGPWEGPIAGNVHFRLSDTGWGAAGRLQTTPLKPEGEGFILGVSAFTRGTLPFFKTMLLPPSPLLQESIIFYFLLSYNWFKLCKTCTCQHFHPSPCQSSVTGFCFLSGWNNKCQQPVYSAELVDENVVWVCGPPQRPSQSPPHWCPQVVTGEKPSPPFSVPTWPWLLPLVSLQSRAHLLSAAAVPRGAWREVHPENHLEPQVKIQFPEGIRFSSQPSSPAVEGECPAQRLPHLFSTATAPHTPGAGLRT